jgi:hypothetical protein
MSKLSDTFSRSSAALDRMRSVAEVDWEKQHGHPAPCPPGCLIRISADQKAAETWGSIQPQGVPDGPYSPNERERKLQRTYGSH